MAKDQGIKVHDAGLVRRTEDGAVLIHDTGDWGFVKGALAGGVVTGAVALIAGPIGWGALAAAGLAGGVIAKVRDAGIKDNALRDLGAQAKQAASALVIMVDPAGEEAIRSVLTTAGAAATTVGLDAATAARLAEAAGAEALPHDEPGSAEAAPQAEPETAEAAPPSEGDLVLQALAAGRITVPDPATGYQRSMYAKCPNDGEEVTIRRVVHELGGAISEVAMRCTRCGHEFTPAPAALYLH